MKALAEPRGQRWGTDRSPPLSIYLSTVGSPGPGSEDDEKEAS